MGGAAGGFLSAAGHNSDSAGLRETGSVRAELPESARH